MCDGSEFTLADGMACDLTCDSGYTLSAQPVCEFTTLSSTTATCTQDVDPGAGGTGGNATGGNTGGNMPCSDDTECAAQFTNNGHGGAYCYMGVCHCDIGPCVSCSSDGECGGGQECSGDAATPGECVYPAATGTGGDAGGAHNVTGGNTSPVNVSKNDEIDVKNEELCIKNEELCIKNEELCMKMMIFADQRVQLQWHDGQR